MRQVDAKSALRESLRRQRNELAPQRQRQAAHDLAEQLKRQAFFRESRAIALYLANDGEIDPRQAMDWCLARGQKCYAPVIAEVDASSAPSALRFAEITAHSMDTAAMRPNRFGIAEPAVAPDALIDARDLDLVLLPLVGFDRRGNRIGMGGGFYDTTFAFKRATPARRPRLVGLAHELQRLERIDADNWDIPISAVVTDQRVYHCEPAADAGDDAN
ncbi:MAG: 5-formyltetrahydrofolate cyclo-ligase [bacterium]